MDSATVELAAVDLADVAKDAVSVCLERATDKGLTLTSSCNGFVVRSDRDMLTAVLRNLVGNAVKFTLPGGAIMISAVQRAAGIEIGVADTGVGMTKAVLSDLFKLDRRTTTIGTAG